MKIKTLCFILVLLVTGSMGTIHASANDQKVKELDIGDSFDGAEGTMVPVSYTHLTLPTICSV